MSDQLEPDAAELLQMAPVVGLNALSSEELSSVEARVAAQPQEFRELFDTQVRATREAMAAISSVTATPPPASLRDRVLAAARAEAGLDAPAPQRGETPPLPVDPPAPVRAEPNDTAAPDTPADDVDDTAASLDDRRRRRTRRLATYLAAAAVAAVAVGAAGWVIGASNNSGPEPTPQLASPAERVFSAADLRSTGGPVGGGNVTLYLASSADTAVLVMNSVPPPAPGTVYQMWLIGPDGPRSAGTMTDEDVEPVTTAVLPGINSASALAFTVEPPGGSAQPTGAPVAQLTLT